MTNLQSATRRTILLLLAFLFLKRSTGSPSASPYSESDSDLYDYVSDQAGQQVEDSRQMTTPTFTSTAQTLVANTGDTVRLPCRVDRLEGFVMLWKKQSDIVTVADQIIDQRFSLETERNGNQLVISRATESDAGVYTCHISAYQLTELQHRLEIRTRPVIRTEPEEMLVVREGSPASLVCQTVSGSPSPRLEWTSSRVRSLYTRLTSGEDRAELSLGLVTREMAGSYTCTAHNGDGQAPVQRTVIVQVQYAPSVTVRERTVHTSLGEEEELVCRVTGVPSPSLTWYRDNNVIDRRTANVLLNQRAGRHSLTLLNIDQASVGHYQCVASNSEGNVTESITLTGQAREAVITSSTESEAKHSYRLAWSVQSRAPVDQFVLSLRKLGAERWTAVEVEAGPEVRETSHGHYTFTGLEEASVYQVTVASRNEFGLKHPENIFTFATQGADPVHQPMVVPSSSSPASSVWVSLLVMLSLSALQY